MLCGAESQEAPTAIRSDLGAIYVSLELSCSKWLMTSLLPGLGEKMSRHTLASRDSAGLLTKLEDLRAKAKARMGRDCAIVAIHEAGLDGFWLHRVLEAHGIESHVVDPASVAVPRKARRAKTDRIDGEALLRTVLAYKRGEPRVCTMVHPPKPEEEDRRRLIRERKTLIAERTQHINRIKGLLYAQGIQGYEPLRRDRRQRLKELTTGDGQALPPHLAAQIERELDRIELLITQIKAVEKERGALLQEKKADTAGAASAQPSMLLGLVGIGPEFAAVLWYEGLFRSFANRRQVAAYAGLAPTPWQSGQVDREQGVSKAGNPRLRTAMIELSWLWLRHQPETALSKWFEKRIKANKGRGKKQAIVAMARKLLVALWKYVTTGELIEGAVIKPA
jgi:transposase